MADINKAIKPIESVRIAPLNDGTIYQANKEIVFRLGAGLNMFLVNKSYLTFNLKCAEKTFNDALSSPGPGDSSANGNFYPSYIRNAANIFKTIEISYGGDVIYTTRTHNIEINTIRQTKYGDDYLDANWATYTTTNMVKNGTAYLKLENITNNGDSTHTKDLIRKEQIIYNVQIPLNQILPIFMDLGSEGFPMRSLNQQIEVRLLIADTYQYLIDWDSKINDFVTNKKNVDTRVLTVNLNKSISERFENSHITLENVYIYANYYTPESSEAAIIDEKCKNGEYKLKYNTWVLDERQVDSIKSTQTIPASVVTTNTKSILVYCFKKQTSPSVMYKPNINNFQLKIGSFTCPLQPIADSTMISPHEYKFQVDDVFDNIDTYFTSTNSDYNKCYLFEGNNIIGTTVTKPSSLFYIFGMNYTSDPTDLGSDSSAWNSQYQMQFNGVNDDGLNDTSSSPPVKGPGLQFVIAVNTECGLLIKENNIKTFTL